MTVATKSKLSPPQLAKLWGIDSAKVIRWIRNGDLRAINIATTTHNRPRYAIDINDIAAFEASRAVAPVMQQNRRKRKRAYKFF